MNMMILVLLAYSNTGLEAMVVGNPQSTKDQCVTVAQKYIKELARTDPGKKYGYICKGIILDYASTAI